MGALVSSPPPKSLLRLLVSVFWLADVVRGLSTYFDDEARALLGGAGVRILLDILPCYGAHNWRVGFGEVLARAVDAGALLEEHVPLLHSFKCRDNLSTHLNV